MDFESDNDMNIEDDMNFHSMRYEIDDIDKVNNYIRELWDNVVVPYLENYQERQILSCLTINDYNKFYEFMITNQEF